MRFYNNQMWGSDGNLIKDEMVEYQADDYKRLIANIEEQITDRRKIEAVLSDGGKQWLAARYDEIDAIRHEARDHLGEGWWQL